MNEEIIFDKKKRFIERITIDITNKCNLKCIMCPQHMKKRKLIEMPLELFERIAEETFPYLEELFLSCAFEPLMSKNFDKIVEIIGRYKIPKTLMITNATLFNKKTVITIIKSGLNAVVISLDGARKTTFEKIRAGADYEKVISSIKLLLDTQKELKSDKPDVTLTFVMMRSNIDELAELVKTAHELGIRRVNFNPLQAHTEDMKEEEIDISCSERLKKSIDAALLLSKKYNIETNISEKLDYYIQDYKEADDDEKGNEVDSLEEGGPENNNSDSFNSESNDKDTKETEESNQKRCVEPFPSFYIEPDGKVFPCTIWQDEPIGDFSKETFEEIWNSKNYTDLRKELLSSNLRDCCRSCCYMI